MTVRIVTNKPCETVTFKKSAIQLVTSPAPIYAPKVVEVEKKGKWFAPKKKEKKVEAGVPITGYKLFVYLWHRDTPATFTYSVGEKSVADKDYETLCKAMQESR